MKEIGWHTIVEIEWHSIQEITWHKITEIRHVIIGVLLAFVASLVVSKTLANVVGEEVQSRDLEFYLGQ